jgi:hypothetical protein
MSFFLKIKKYEEKKVTEYFGTDPDPHPDPLVRGTDLKIRIRIRIRTKNLADPEHCFLLCG